MKFITFYLYIVSELQFYISFNILLDNEVMQTSKRRSFLPLIFIIKCISKRSLRLIQTGKIFSLSPNLGQLLKKKE